MDKVVAYCFKYSYSWYKEPDKWDDEGCGKVWVADKSKAKTKVFFVSECDSKKDFCTIQVRRLPDMDLLENEPTSLALQITKEQKYKMAHAYGIKTYGGHESNWENWGYRNRYITKEDPDWEDLVAKGLAEKEPFRLNRHQEEFYYSLTPLGIDTIRSLYPIFRKVKEEKIKGIMTKQEMLQALDAGKRVTHTYFASNEWMEKLEGTNRVIFEDGVSMFIDDFWKDRQGIGFENGWSLVNKTSHETI